MNEAALGEKSRQELMPVSKWYNRKRLARQVDANGSQNANKIQNKCE